MVDKEILTEKGFGLGGYAVSTVGFEEIQVKAYIKQQEQLDGIQGREEEGSFYMDRFD